MDAYFPNHSQFSTLTDYVCNIVRTSRTITKKRPFEAQNMSEVERKLLFFWAIWRDLEKIGFQFGLNVSAYKHWYT